MFARDDIAVQKIFNENGYKLVSSIPLYLDHGIMLTMLTSVWGNMFYPYLFGLWLVLLLPFTVCSILHTPSVYVKFTRNIYLKFGWIELVTVDNTDNNTTTTSSDQQPSDSNLSVVSASTIIIDRKHLSPEQIV